MKELKVAGLGYRTLPVLLVFLAFLLVVAVDGQTANGFVSIDCGQEKNYTDTATGLPYVYDNGFVATGENHKIPADMEKYASNEQGYHLRSFPDGTRNCYTLSVQRGKKYLIRASFLYANYNKLDRIPQFDLYLDVNPRISVNLNGSRSHHMEEILAFASRNSMFVCLVNTGSGTPFISSLELRPLEDDIYPLVNSNQSSVLFRRFNIQPIRDEILRYPNDSYDRMWMPYFSESLETLSTKSNDIKPCCKDEFKAPLDALKTCGVAAANGSTINITLEWPLLNIKSRNMRYVLHKAEIQSLTTDQSRNSTVISNLWNGKRIYKYRGYLTSGYFYNREPITLSDAFLNFTLRKASGSTHPPILNAIEVYEVKELTEPSTKEEEVVAIMEVKTFYKVKMNWEGDPCAPKRLVWEGITCSQSSIVSLNLTSNGLSGYISVGFKDLKQLGSLDLSNNNLTGTIPYFLADLQNLVFLNLSGNHLNGLIPNDLQQKSNDGILKMSLEGNRLLCSNQCGKSSNKIAIIIPIVVTSVIVVLAVIMIIIWKRKKEPNELRGIDLQTGSFTLRQIKAATKNFDPTNKVGEGGFGSVYKGVLSDETVIAVKQLSSMSKQGNREFVNEIGMISALQHPNLVKLYGCCTEGNQLILIYEYMENNCLARALFARDPTCRLILDWPTRCKIYLGIARGLAYLHEESRLKIVHRDIKASNVLLDKYLNAKISDFGLAKLDEDDHSHISTRIAGTFGYMAPKYAMRGYLTDKADVYSFGVVALEIVSGKSNMNDMPMEDFAHLLDWASVLDERGNLLELVDPELGTGYSKEEATLMIKVGLLCTNAAPTLRPSMSTVVSMLQGLTPVASVISELSSAHAATEHRRNQQNLQQTEKSNEDEQSSSLLEIYCGSI